MASYEETLKVTVEILKKHMEKERPVHPGDNIQSDLGLDSLGVMEVVADIEERFEIAIPSDVLANLATVEDVVSALQKLQNV